MIDYEIACKNFSKKFLIYALCEPETNDVRYIGRSCKGLRRARASAKENIKNAYKSNWINTLLKQGLKPDIKVICYANSKEELYDLEMFWIKEARLLFPNLTNISDGGLDQNPFKCGDVNPMKKLENRILNGQRSKIHQNRPEMIKHQSDLAKERWQNEEYRNKLMSNSKSRFTDEVKKKMSLAGKGRPNPKIRKSIICINNNEKYASILEAAEKLDIFSGNICKVLNGSRNHTGGFKFEYYN